MRSIKRVVMAKASEAFAPHELASGRVRDLVGGRVSRPAWDQIWLPVRRQIMDQIEEDSR